MTRLLALDTAGNSSSVALLENEIIVLREETGGRNQARTILGLVQDVCREKAVALESLDAVAFARGPGSFTGARLAASVTQGLAFAHDLPVVPVSSLVAHAQAANRLQQATNCLVVLDARMGEVYWSACKITSEGLMASLGDEHLSKPLDVELPSGQEFTAVGSGWTAYPEELAKHIAPDANRLFPEIASRADDVAVLARAAFDAGQAVAVQHAVPVYLRTSSAWKKSN